MLPYTCETVVEIVIVMVAHSSHARILKEAWTNHSPPVLFLSGDPLVRTSSTLQARISPQWLSELRQL